MIANMIRDFEARLMALVIKPLENRIAALEARQDGGDAPAAPKTARGRGKAADAPAAGPQATVHDVVVQATEPAAEQAPKAK